MAAFWGVPPKSFFCGRNTRTAIKRATVFGPSEEFQKSSCTLVVLWWGYNPRERITPFPDTRGAPYKETKNGRCCPTQGGFWVSVAGHLGFLEEVYVISLHYPSAPLRKWKRTWGFLKIPPNGWDIGVFMRAFLEKNTYKSLVFRGQIWKLGRKSVSPIFSAFTGLNI